MSPSVRVFESRLDKMWNNQLMKFNYTKKSSASNGRIWTQRTASYVQHTPMMMMMMMTCVHCFCRATAPSEAA